MRIPIVPAHFAGQGPGIQEITGAIQKPPRNNSNQPKAHRKSTIHGFCLFLCHNLGILYQISKWHLAIDADFFLQMSTFQILHVLGPIPRPELPSHSLFTYNSVQVMLAPSVGQGPTGVDWQPV